MALPKIAHVVYPIEFKSIGMTTTFRPFTVAEEKILLMIKETKDPKMVQVNLNTLIKNCVQDPIDPDKLAMYDVENFFVRIRSKSVGEIVELEHKDKKTGKTQKATVNLDDAIVVTPEGRTNKIELIDGVGLIMRDPLYSDMIHYNTNDSTTAGDAIWGIIISCITKVYDKDTVYEVGVDTTLDELTKFVTDLPTKASRKLYEHFNDMPHLEAKAKLEDGTTITLSGIMNFLV